MIKIDKKLASNIEIDAINNLNLRSDLENNNIYLTTLIPQGYVGNRPNGYKEDFHEDDTWAIDCFKNSDVVVESYLYSSKYEYKQDLYMLENHRLWEQQKTEKGWI